MGASESRSHEEADDATAAAAAQDYYAILEVDENANADEIRRSFRRLALIHHPDKNHDDPEGATQRFAALQQAYEVGVPPFCVRFFVRIVRGQKNK